VCVAQCIVFVRFLNESDEQPDRDLLREIFSLPKPKEISDQGEVEATQTNKGEIIKPDPKVEPKKRDTRCQSD